MEVTIHASGSKGNAYSIIDGDHKLLIDPGIAFNKLQKATGFSLTSYDAVLLSHEHKDHSLSIKQLVDIGLKCAMSAPTADALGIENADVLPLTPDTVCSLSEWRILPFEVEHDAALPLGFMIRTPSKKRLFYATDTYYIKSKYHFRGINYWLVEANYDKAMLEANPELDDGTKIRIKKSHFEIGNLKKFMAQQDMDKTRAIYLIHLSESNSNRPKFIREIQQITGRPVY